jgi:hypothetical protein
MFACFDPIGSVDPRVCGGNSIGTIAKEQRQGRSPRVRGKLDRNDRKGAAARSIPACAGETKACCLQSFLPAVDPRVCGGNHLWPRIARPQRGRSPRVRGKQPRLARRPDRWGSMPACAGETMPPPARSAACRVDPRVCGGNGPFAARPLRPGGRSPRVRGKHIALRGQLFAARSIPACAGETNRDAWEQRSLEVDPRVCGGNKLPCKAAIRCGGRSPRVRGKLFLRLFPLAG